jgi:hypothetical protein
MLVTANVPSSWIFSTVKMEATRSSETSVLTTPTWRHIPGDRIFALYRDKIYFLVLWSKLIAKINVIDLTVDHFIIIVSAITFCEFLIIERSADIRSQVSEQYRFRSLVILLPNRHLQMIYSICCRSEGASSFVSGVRYVAIRRRQLPFTAYSWYSYAGGKLQLNLYVKCFRQLNSQTCRTKTEEEKDWVVWSLSFVRIPTNGMTCFRS